MQLFYNAEITEKHQNFTFDKTESRHIVKVLRKSEGDTVFITNGKGGLFTCQINVASDKKCFVKVVNFEQKQKLQSYYLHIAIAPTKLNDRFEWFLEKATEIGVDEITPVICEHSERKVVKLERMQKIIQSAGKQSLTYHFPVLNTPVTFQNFIKNAFEGQLFIAHCENDKKSSLKTICKPNTKTTILIGPEGDFSKTEITKSKDKGFLPVSLGKSRLRTETAGVVAVHSVCFLNEKT